MGRVRSQTFGAKRSKKCGSVGERASLGVAQDLRATPDERRFRRMCSNRPLPDLGVDGRGRLRDAEDHHPAGAIAARGARIS